MREQSFTGRLFLFTTFSFIVVFVLANPAGAIRGVGSAMSWVADSIFGGPEVEESEPSEPTAELSEPAETAEEAATADEEPSSSSSGADAGAVALLVGAGVGGLALLAGSGYGARALHRRHRSSAADRRMLANRWKAAKKRHVELREKSYPIETGLLARVDYPALFDYSDPATAAWVEAAEAASVLDVDTAPLHSETRIAAYETAVGRADRAWDAAFANARRVNLSRFTPEERSRVEKARKLLTRVLDAGASEHERQIAYAKAIDLLGDLVEVPPKVLLALEERFHLRLAIEAGLYEGEGAGL